MGCVVLVPFTVYSLFHSHSIAVVVNCLGPMGGKGMEGGRPVRHERSMP